ncbi:MAG: IS5 family transposase [Nitrospirota bacterium]
MNYKTTKPKGFFDEEFRLEKLADQKDPLVKLRERIDFELFRPLLEKSLYKVVKSNAGARPYDYVMMFKVLILQRYYNIGDDKMEFAILDRLSFMRFLSLSLSDKVPDAKTIWHFREQLVKEKAVEKLFDLFKEELYKKNLIANEGKMVDASFVEVPIQRNSREENKQVKEGIVPDEWKKKPNKLEQKDTDARWTKKNNTTYYGYKDHIKADAKSKLIDTYTVTDASVHDSQEIESLITEEDKEQSMYADSAYRSEEIETMLKEKEIDSQVHEKGHRNNPLTNQQKETNKVKSKTRARVEHIFGFIENSMNSPYIQTIGIKRATAVIGLMNLTYNMFRYTQLISLQSG